jgi:hypothetical protein
MILEPNKHGSSISLKNNDYYDLRKIKDPLDLAKEIINDLEKEIEKKETIWNELRELNPDWDQLSEENWIYTESNCWLHGTTEAIERHNFEKWLSDYPPLTKTAQIPARKIHRAWRKWLETKGPHLKDFGPKGAYYVEFAEFQITKPKKDELLIHFIIRLAQSVKENSKEHRLEWRALKSFLNFIRKTYLPKEVAFIEHIFPKKMDLNHGRIIRKIAPEVPAIPQAAAAEILMELGNICLYGKSNAILTALESLGLCWLCLTASRLRLPIHLKKVLYNIKSTSVQFDDKYPILLVPTLFGDRPIRISWRIAKFLQALSLIPSPKPRKTILQKPFRSLTRTFEKALKTAIPNSELGNITYVSLLSPPHHFGNDR